MMKPEQYENIVALLKEALEFYGNQENYIEKPMNDGLVSMTELDTGNQARFALEKIKEFTKATDKMEAEFVKNMVDAIENDDSPENVMKIIETYKKIGNGN